MSEGVKDTASKGEVKGAEAPREGATRRPGRAEAEPSQIAVDGRQGGGKGLARGS